MSITHPAYPNHWPISPSMHDEFPQDDTMALPRKSYEQVIEDITHYIEAAAVASLSDANPRITGLTPIVEEADDDVNPEVERMMEGFLNSLDDDDVPQVATPAPPPPPKSSRGRNKKAKS